MEIDLNITIYINKTKNNIYCGLQNDYISRLKKFCNISIKNSEFSKPNKSYVINISKKAKSISSTDFAKKIEDIFVNGYSNIVFCMTDTKVSVFDFELCISSMDISYNIELTMLIEQIYRAFKINNNEVYHK